jgi:hypothetical protein
MTAKNHAVEAGEHSRNRVFVLGKERVIECKSTHGVSPKGEWLSSNHFPPGERRFHAFFSAQADINQPRPSKPRRNT